MSWLIWASIFLLTAGFAKLSAVALNRLLAIPRPKWFIALAEVTQISLIPIYAWLLLRGFGGLQLRQQFVMLSDATIAQWGLPMIAIGIVGFVLLIRSTIAYQQYRPPSCQITANSTIIDFRKSVAGNKWRTTLVGPRPMRRIALLPGNQQFSVEVSTKTFLLPRLPKNWDGLSIVQIADTHFRGAVARVYFEAVCEQAIALKPDLFVFTGDLLDNPSLLSWFQETLGRLNAPLGQFFILGNHDWYLNTSEIRQEFGRHHWVDLAGRSHDLTSTHSCPVVLAGDETPWMGLHPHLPVEPNGSFRILISHTPDNIVWARDHQIDLMIAGHTHGGQIRLPIIGPVYSPSRFGCQFSSGVFWLDPTLLYVSRGLSGREPIRYQCVPELTKLVLRSPLAT